LGQIASTRADLLSPEYQAELARLQDAVPAEPWPTIREVLISELGPLMPQVDPVPLAAASIGQAHAGVLRDGTEVVIKVRRPGVTDIVNADLDLIEAMAGKLARRWPMAAHYDLPALADQFGTTLRQELDYFSEAAHARQFAANFSGDPSVRIPRVFGDLSTSRVLTLERMHGIKVDDLQGLDQAGINRSVLARRAATVILQMVYRDGFFHADPHPGNFFIQPDGAIGLIDFGMVGTLDEAARHGLLRALVAIGAGDGGALVDALVSLGLTGRNVDRPQLSADLSRLFYHQLDRPIAEIALAELLAEVFTIVRHHHLVLPPQLALLLKTMVMWEGLGAQLDPSFRLLDAVVTFTSDVRL
jgi:ubiquinone biosynthesis protein